MKPERERETETDIEIDEQKLRDRETDIERNTKGREQDQKDTQSCREFCRDRMLQTQR